jgi:hypothetical protein
VTSDWEMPASFRQSLHGCRVRFSSPSVSCSNLPRVMVMLKCFAPAPKAFALCTICQHTVAPMQTLPAYHLPVGVLRNTCRSNKLRMVRTRQAPYPRRQQ